MEETVQKLFFPAKGIFAMDASPKTMTKRMEAVGISSTPETRRAFRELLVTIPGLEEFISGAILNDETIHQKITDGRTFVEVLESVGIIPGIKVDKGTKDMANFPGERIAEGLDELRERLAEYKKMGAKFAKFRTVVTIGDEIPTATCLNSNAEIQARYAALCQEQGIVAIVEPEVLMEGKHDFRKSEEVGRMNLETAFKLLKAHKVFLPGMILKASWVHPGFESGIKPTDQEVAEATARVLKSTVPTALGGVVFLSGGDSPEDASSHLDAIVELGPHPWKITFSFERALEGPAMEIWKGRMENIKLAQEAVYKRAKLNSLATKGDYGKELENG